MYRLLVNLLQKRDTSTSLSQQPVIDYIAGSYGLFDRHRLVCAQRCSIESQWHHCPVGRFWWKLVKPSALVLLSSSLALGSIRPSFYLNACSWNATEIVVLAPTSQAGTFRVIEAIKGGLAPGESLELPGLTPSQGATGRLSELSKLKEHLIVYSRAFRLFCKAIG